MINKETDHGYIKELYEDPEFYHISYEEYSLIKIFQNEDNLFDSEGRIT